MYRCLTLSALLLCAVVQYSNGGSIFKDWDNDETQGWDEKKSVGKDWDKMEGGDWDAKADKIKDVLWKCVKEGKLSEEIAKKMHESLKWGKENGMKLDMKNDWGEDKAWKDDWKDDDKTDGWTMDKDKKHAFKKAMKRLGYLFKDAHSSGTEWANKLKHVMYFIKNQKDPLIDVDHKNTMHVAGVFSSPPQPVHMCGVDFTLPEVSVETKFNGDSLPAAVTRDFPKLKIRDHNGNEVHDGLYTMVGVMRGLNNSDNGDFEHPAILFMTINIPGGDIHKGDVIVPYLTAPFDSHVNYFLYEQNDRIDHDFAISQYTNWIECKYRFRCQFQQERFVSTYNLHLRWVGRFAIEPCLYSAYFFNMVVRQMDSVKTCTFFLEFALPAILERDDVNLHDKEELTQGFEAFADHVMTEEAKADKKFHYYLNRQLNALKKIFIKGQSHDDLIPFFADLDEKVAFRYIADPTTVKMCGLKFDLPAVKKDVYFKDHCDHDRVELYSSEIRKCPHVLIKNKDPHHSKTGQLFTLLIVDRSNPRELAEAFGRPVIEHIGNFNRPFINYMVVNIKDRKTKTGSVIVPYHAWPASTGQYVMLYEQKDVIKDLPMDKYADNDNECWVENRCLSSLKELTYDYDLRLASVARYEIKRDIFSDTYMSRFGRDSPDGDCETYLKSHHEVPEGGYE